MKKRKLFQLKKNQISFCSTTPNIFFRVTTFKEQESYYIKGDDEGEF